MLIYVEKKMPIWSKPSDRFYYGPAIYRLIVNKQNYCGKTFRFRPRMCEHKSDSKLWRNREQDYGDAQDVHKLIDNNWDDVVIEIIARYPNKRKGVEADELFMDEREIEGIALYNSYHNGLNMTPGGKLRSEEINRKTSESGKIAQNRPEVKARISASLIGNKRALGSKRTQEQLVAQSKRQYKPLTATKGDRTWAFESTLKARKVLERDLKTTLSLGNISLAARGKYSKANLHVYKGVTFKYD